jgi:hypothetical protein
MYAEERLPGYYGTGAGGYLATGYFGTRARGGKEELAGIWIGLFLTYPDETVPQIGIISVKKNVLTADTVVSRYSTACGGTLPDKRPSV